MNTRYTLYFEAGWALDVTRKQARRLLPLVIMRARSCEARQHGQRYYVGQSKSGAVFNLVISREAA